MGKVARRSLTGRMLADSTMSESATLVAALVAAAASLVSLLLNSRLTYDRERRQALVRKEMERLFSVEEMAGELSELVGSYAWVPSGGSEARLQELFTEIDATAGRMSRYPDVRQALRELSNVCKRLFVARRDHEDDRAVRAELELALKKLHASVDAILGRRVLAT